MTLVNATEEWPGALVTGTLGATESAGTVFFTLKVGGSVYGLVFQPGFTAQRGTPMKLLDPNGTVVGVVGDELSFGGGEYPDGISLWTLGPPIEAPWLAIP